MLILSKKFSNQNLLKDIAKHNYFNEYNRVDIFYCIKCNAGSLKFNRKKILVEK